MVEEYTTHIRLRAVGVGAVAVPCSSLAVVGFPYGPFHPALRALREGSWYSLEVIPRCAGAGAPARRTVKILVWPQSLAQRPGRTRGTDRQVGPLGSTIAPRGCICPSPRVLVGPSCGSAAGIAATSPRALAGAVFTLRLSSWSSRPTFGFVVLRRDFDGARLCRETRWSCASPTT